MTTCLDCEVEAVFYFLRTSSAYNQLYVQMVNGFELSLME